jgi:hypothetical protein
VSGSSSPSSFCQNGGEGGGGGGAGAAACQQHIVTYHVHSGEVISLQLGDGSMQVIPGRTHEA